MTIISRALVHADKAPVKSPAHSRHIRLGIASPFLVHGRPAQHVAQGANRTKHFWQLHTFSVASVTMLYSTKSTVSTSLLGWALLCLGTVWIQLQSQSGIGLYSTISFLFPRCMDKHTCMTGESKACIVGRKLVEDKDMKMKDKNKVLLREMRKNNYIITVYHLYNVVWDSIGV